MTTKPNHAEDMRRHLAALEGWMEPHVFARLNAKIENAIALRDDMNACQHYYVAPDDTHCDNCGAERKVSA